MISRYTRSRLEDTPNTKIACDHSKGYSYYGRKQLYQMMPLRTAGLLPVCLWCPDQELIGADIKNGPDCLYRACERHENHTNLTVYLKNSVTTSIECRT